MGVGLAARAAQIHGLAVGSETDYSLVVFSVEFAFHRLGALPLALFVLAGHPDVALLHAGDFALFGTGYLLVGGGEIEHVLALGIDEHRREVGAA